MNMTLLIPEGDTLITYYLLPLVDVNKNVFSKSFKTSYINKKGTTIYVELTEPMKSPIYKLSPFFLAETYIEGVLFITFKIPSRFLKDSQYFIKGLYSQMSTEAKKSIYATSTLPYNKKLGGFAVSHPVLQALNKTKTLRKFLLAYFQVETLSNSEELIDVPAKWWFIEDRINTITLKLK